MPDLHLAAHFIAASARVLDRRRFERLFAGGPPDPVRDAVAAYRNADGGLGHALEPDCRAPGSQPATIAFGLNVLDEADAWDGELVAGALDHLQRIAPAEGGAVFVDPSIEGWPAAPWWTPRPGATPALVTTGQIAAPLHARGVSHPWLQRATAWLWGELEGGLGELGPYDALGALRFLDAVADRDRATAAARRLVSALEAGDLVDLDPGAAGETHGPLFYAPRPDSVARGLFDDAVVEAHLDHLAAAQKPDGGWTFNWPAWSPAAERDWRGAVTVDALVLLRHNGRLEAAG
jgi:hypothetical protein